MPTRMLLLAVLLLGWLPASAQTSASDPESTPIQDNSFLVEEAYNQEAGVVQHINTFTRLWDSKSWEYTFTQEWPFFSPKHQLSYTLVGLDPGRGVGAGFGDLLLNYRFQLLGSGKERVASSPRFSLLLPTGDAARGRGAGGVGFQVNLPLSVVLHKKLVTHWNLGGTVVPNAENEGGEEATITGHNAGVSAIWLAHPRFNALVEAVWERSQSVVGPEVTESGDEIFIAPAVRWAHNFENGLQIVPGISLPVGVGESSGEVGVIFYLSFEHPFGKR